MTAFKIDCDEIPWISGRPGVHFTAGTVLFRVEEAEQ